MKRGNAASLLHPESRQNSRHFCRSALCRLCSLIPGFGVKLSAIILAGPTVLSAVGACPPHDGVRRRWWINVASAEEHWARVTGRGASLEGDPACVARKRAVTQEPPDRGSVDIVGPRYIRLRLASGEALHGFLALVRRHLARTTEAHAARLGALATLARAGADKLALELSPLYPFGQPIEHQM
jgi:hypothetical protein